MPLGPARGLRIAALLLSSAALALPARAVPPRESGPPHAEAGRTIEGPGGGLYVEVLGSGSGTPLVVINGGPGLDHAHLHCTAAWESLALRRRVVLYDQRGVGRSDRLAPGAGVTTGDQAADLEAVRRFLGAERLDLLGHSYGGFLAMEYAAENPARVAHLILCDSASPNWSRTSNVVRALFPERGAILDSLAAPGIDGPTFRRVYRDFMGMMFCRPEKREEFLAHPEWNDPVREVNRALTEDMRDQDLSPALAEFGARRRFPVLVATGRYDVITTPATAYQIHLQVRGSRFEVFEQSGHLPFFEEPAAFVRVVDGFLSGS